MSIIAILIGVFFLIHGNAIFGLICIILGIGNILIFEGKKDLSEIEELSVDRSESIVDKIGGVNNIDINLSKYGDKSQLLVLKDKSIHIGYNNYEVEKTINFDSIINVEIRTNKVIEGTAYEYSTNYNKEIIESIIVYIHTNDSTEELIFEYSSYEDEQIQIKYNEILKGLKRFKAILDYTLGTDDLDNETNINIKDKSIPQQIKEYKELLDIDAITKEEYETKKKELLSK